MKEVTKVYVAYKPCKKPEPEFQWNGYGGRNSKYIPISSVEYFEDDTGYYWEMGEMTIEI